MKAWWCRLRSWLGNLPGSLKRVLSGREKPEQVTHIRTGGTQISVVANGPAVVRFPAQLTSMLPPEEAKRLHLGLLAIHHRHRQSLVGPGVLAPLCSVGDRGAVLLAEITAGSSPEIIAHMLVCPTKAVDRC